MDQDSENVQKSYDQVAEESEMACPSQSRPKFRLMKKEGFAADFATSDAVSGVSMLVSPLSSQGIQDATGTSRSDTRAPKYTPRPR
jgi:hypothetical protein